METCESAEGRQGTPQQFDEIGGPGGEPEEDAKRQRQLKGQGGRPEFELFEVNVSKCRPRGHEAGEPQAALPGGRRQTLIRRAGNGSSRTLPDEPPLRGVCRRISGGRDIH